MTQDYARANPLSDTELLMQEFEPNSPQSATRISQLTSRADRISKEIEQKEAAAGGKVTDETTALRAKRSQFENARSDELSHHGLMLNAAQIGPDALFDNSTVRDMAKRTAGRELTPAEEQALEGSVKEANVAKAKAEASRAKLIDIKSHPSPSASPEETQKIISSASTQAAKDATGKQLAANKVSKTIAGIPTSSVAEQGVDFAKNNLMAMSAKKKAVGDLTTTISERGAEGVGSVAGPVARKALPTVGGTEAEKAAFRSSTGGLIDPVRRQVIMTSRGLSDLPADEVDALAQRHFEEQFPQNSKGKINYSNNIIGKLAGKERDIVHAPLSALTRLTAGDAFKRSLYDQARSAALNAVGKDGEALSASEFTSKVRDLMDEPTEQMLARAKDNAQQASLTKESMLGSELSSVQQSTKESAKDAAFKAEIQAGHGTRESIASARIEARRAAQAAGKTPEEILAAGQQAATAERMRPYIAAKKAEGSLRAQGGKLMSFFSQTPGAIVQKMYQYSPAGLLDTAGAYARKDAAAFDKSLGRAIVGTGLMGGGAALAAKGLYHGNNILSGPESVVQKQEGLQQGSLQVGNRQIGLQQIPAAAPLSAGASAMEAPGGIGDKLYAGAGSYINSAINQSSLKGLEKIIQTVQDPGAYLPGLAASYAGALVPGASLLSAANQAINPTQRVMPRGVIQGIESRVAPGMLPAQLNPLGEETKDTSIVDRATNFLTPLTVTESNNDPATQQLKKMNDAGFSVSPTTVPTSQTIAGTKIPIDPKTQEFLQQRIGARAKALLLQLSGSNMPMDAQQKFFTENLTRYKNFAYAKTFAPTIKGIISGLQQKESVGGPEGLRARDTLSSLYKNGIIRDMEMPVAPPVPTLSTTTTVAPVDVND